METVVDARPQLSRGSDRTDAIEQRLKALARDLGGWSMVAGADRVEE
jgi:hypothetical protein